MERSSENSGEVFYCRNAKRNVEARGIYRGDSFLLLKGSTLRSDHPPYMEHTSLPAWKKKMIGLGMLKEQGGVLVLQGDCVVEGKPSAASEKVLGKSSNGWTEWKNAEGKTLDELYRKDK